MVRCLGRPLALEFNGRFKQFGAGGGGGGGEGYAPKMEE
jgi:hypothetical protein